MKGLELFFQLVKFLPQLQILQIGNTPNICSELVDRLKECGGSLDLIADKKIECDSDIVTQKIKEYNTTLNIKARNYENVIVTDIFDDLSDEQIKSLLTECYHSLENSAELAIIIKKDMKLQYRVHKALDEIEYRAINDDVGIFDDYYVLTAKKLHMWGNGQ